MLKSVLGLMIAGALIATVPDEAAASRRGKSSHDRQDRSSSRSTYIHGNERFYPVPSHHKTPAARFFAYQTLGR